MHHRRPGEPRVISPSQELFLSWVVELLVDIVVLNLFVEFVHTIVIDSFAISILTAVLLKLMVDAVKGLEQRVSAYFAAKPGAISKVLRVVAVWLILFLSKFVILEATTSSSAASSRSPRSSSSCSPRTPRCARCTCGSPGSTRSVRQRVLDDRA